MQTRHMRVFYFLGIHLETMDYIVRRVGMLTNTFPRSKSFMSAHRVTKLWFRQRSVMYCSICNNDILCKIRERERECLIRCKV